MNPNPKVLIVEDEDPLRMALNDALRSEGYRTIEAADGIAGYEMASSEAPDLILLDLMLPGRDGFSVLKELRQKRVDVPVIILSARGEEWDRIQGFEFGADDYLVKLFSTKELLLRMKVALRRTSGDATEIASHTFGKVRVDFAGYCLDRDGIQFGLSRKEMDLLRYFLSHPGQTLTRVDLLDHVWGKNEFPTNRTIDTHVLKLRKKIETETDHPQHLITVHGVGYKFVPHPIVDI